MGHHRAMDLQSLACGKVKGVESVTQRAADLHLSDMAFDLSDTAFHLSASRLCVRLVSPEPLLRFSLLSVIKLCPGSQRGSKHTQVRT